jgi:hypothetical protein
MKNLFAKINIFIISMFCMCTAYAYSNKAYEDAINDLGSRSDRSDGGLLISGIAATGIMLFVARSQVNRGESKGWYALPVATFFLFTVVIIL